MEGYRIDDTVVCSLFSSIELSPNKQTVTTDSDHLGCDYIMTIIAIQPSFTTRSTRNQGRDDQHTHSHHHQITFTRFPDNMAIHFAAIRSEILGVGNGADGVIHRLRRSFTRSIGRSAAV